MGRVRVQRPVERGPKRVARTCLEGGGGDSPSPLVWLDSPDPCGSGGFCRVSPAFVAVNWASQLSTRFRLDTSEWRGVSGGALAEWLLVSTIQGTSLKLHRQFGPEDGGTQLKSSNDCLNNCLNCLNDYLND